MSKEGRFSSFQIPLTPEEGTKDLATIIKKLIPLRFTGVAVPDAPFICEFNYQNTKLLNVCVKIFSDEEDNTEVNAILGFFSALEILRQ